MTAKQAKHQQLSQLATEARTRINAAATQAAALRGELGREAQQTVLRQLSAEYRALKAAGRTAEAAQLKAMVFSLVPME